ncbi:MAG TPA: hypothetical protein VL088_09065 [Pedobacter sp.]|nr:hypothetical protein [Pedobacter sp.]
MENEKAAINLKIGAEDSDLEVDLNDFPVFDEKEVKEAEMLNKVSKDASKNRKLERVQADVERDLLLDGNLNYQKHPAMYEM